MTKEEESKLQELTYKKQKEIELDEYYDDVQYYFRNLLWYIELDKSTLVGSSGWLSISPDHLKIISLKAKLDIDGEEFNDYIVCSLSERDGYYRVYRTESIYFEYKEKVYEIILEQGDYELGTGDYIALISVSEFNKCDLDLKSVELYLRCKHPNQEELSLVKEKYYQMRLNYNTNVITEVIKIINAEDKARTNKKQEV